MAAAAAVRAYCDIAMTVSIDATADAAGYRRDVEKYDRPIKTIDCRRVGPCEIYITATLRAHCSRRSRNRTTQGVPPGYT